jgi:hypothetical protein
VSSATGSLSQDEAQPRLRIGRVERHARVAAAHCAEDRLDRRDLVGQHEAHVAAAALARRNDRPRDRERSGVEIRICHTRIGVDDGKAVGALASATARESRRKRHPERRSRSPRKPRTPESARRRQKRRRACAWRQQAGVHNGSPDVPFAIVRPFVSSRIPARRIGECRLNEQPALNEARRAIVAEPNSPTNRLCFRAAHRSIVAA